MAETIRENDATQAIPETPPTRGLSVVRAGEHSGLKFERFFSREGVHPYDELEWETRDAVIKNWRDGSVSFEQKEVEFPASWSMNATTIVAQKYFRGTLGTPQRERSVRQMIDRVADTVTRWGREGGYFADEESAEAFNAELKHLLVNQKASFNSPVWFNVGVEEAPQCSACQPYHALISTPEGMVPIGELVEGREVGREVYDASGTTRIVAVKANGQKPVWRVRLRNGSYVEATPDHVVKAVEKRRGASVWVRVDQLLPGMRLQLHPHRARVAARALVAAGGQELFAGLDDVDYFEATDEPNSAERAEAALAGWLQADGFVGQYAGGTNKSLTIEFQVAGDDEYRWVMENLDVALPHVHRKVREADTQQTRVRRIRLYGEVLRDFVEKWELLARGTEIRVPSRLWTATTDEAVAYLRSVFQADGYVTLRRDKGYENGRIGFAVIGERWTEELQILLSSIGIYSRRVHKREKRPNREDIHEVAISIGSERARFAELIGFIGADKQHKLLETLELRNLKTCGDVREEEIVAIEEIGVQDVYDIQTESGEYLTNNVAVHNCFILHVDDDMRSILNWYTEEGIIFKGGSGSGVNLSSLRSSKELVNGGGEASGPVSFMRGADASAGTIKSGGKTRRAAKMVVLNVDHPDVEEFVWTKAKEEQKARALREAGFDMDLDGADSHSLQYQNANNSVRVNDAFMRAYENDEEYDLKAVTSGETLERRRARDVMRQIALAAWECADPGMQYDTTINDWHTCPESGRINASNPCSEYMHIDNSACNLASLNLKKFYDYEADRFDVEAFRRAVEVIFSAQEILVGFSSYPTEKIGENARAFRELGLGYANLGGLLMSLGLPYDSDAGRAWAASLTALMCGWGYRTSAEMARVVGPFDGFEANQEAMLRVLRKHRDAVEAIDGQLVPPELFAAAVEAWDQAVELGEKHGVRNSQATVLAPTGTIGLAMDCDTTGIEPDLGLVKTKKLVGGGSMAIVNRTVPQALERLGYDDGQIEAITAHIDEHKTILDAPELTEEHMPVFSCAMGDNAIDYMGHVHMMAAVQPFLSGAISKTVNMPEEVTVEDVEQLYVDAWKMGLKAIAIYRDNCKVAQPLSVTKKAAKATATARTGGEMVRHKLPKKRPSQTLSFRVGEAKGYLTTGEYPDDGLGEIFLRLGKQGSTLAGLIDAFAISLSIGLQYGVPLEAYLVKFMNMRFEPSGMTDDPEVRMASSIIDYLARRLAIEYLDPAARAELGILTSSEREQALESGHTVAAEPYGEDVDLSQERPARKQIRDSDAPLCYTCGVRMTRSGACHVCPSCGTTSGCS